MSIENIFLLLMSAYFGFHLVCSLLTGNAAVFRNRKSTRNDNPKQYWGFIALMGIGCAGCLFFAFRP
jgi:hypothetical protein